MLAHVCVCVCVCMCVCLYYACVCATVWAFNTLWNLLPVWGPGSEEQQAMGTWGPEVPGGANYREQIFQDPAFTPKCLNQSDFIKLQACLVINRPHVGMLFFYVWNEVITFFELCFWFNFKNQKIIHWELNVQAECGHWTMSKYNWTIINGRLTNTERIRKKQYAQWGHSCMDKGKAFVFLLSLQK